MSSLETCWRAPTPLVPETLTGGVLHVGEVSGQFETWRVAGAGGNPPIWLLVLILVSRYMCIYVACFLTHPFNL